MKKKKRNDSRTKKIQTIIISVLLIANGLATFTLLRNVKIPWVDEAIYVSMGKYIFSNGKYGYMDVFRAFGLPLIAGVTWIIGFSPLSFLKYLSIFSWFFSALVLYEIERKILKTGNFFSLISFLFFVGFSIYYTRALTDSISMFLSLLGFYFLLKRDFLSSGFFFGFSGLVRYTGIVYFTIAIISYFMNEIIHKKDFHLKIFLRNVGVFSLMFLIVFAPNLLLSKIYFGSYLYTLLSTFKNRYEQMWYGDANIVTHLGFIVFSPLLFSIFLAMKNERFNYEYSLSFIFVVLLLLLFFSSPIMTKEKRYFMFILPFASLLSSVGYKYFEKYFNNRILLTVLLALFILAVLKSYLTFSKIKWYRDPNNLYDVYKQIGREIYVTDAKTIFTNDFLLGAYYDVSLKFFGDWKHAEGAYNSSKLVDLVILDMCGTPCNPSDYLCSSGYYKNRTIEVIENDGFKLRTKLYYSFGDKKCEYLVFKK